MTLRIWQVDAFADAPFTGNPAAICILPAARDAAWMQAVGREMNLSETAFLVRRDDGSYDLRWFTPAVEVDLCGHATIASAHVLWEEGFLRLDEQARFHSKSGLLTATRDGDWIELDFPADQPTPIEAPPGLDEALGAELVQVMQGRHDLLVELQSEAIVRELTPDIRALMSIKARGIIVTARASTQPFDFVSRFFAPNAGVDEDPVTGSSFCLLTPYWTPQLGKAELMAYQASARGGIVRTSLRGERVLIAGHAVTVLKGDLLD
jgi:PhzF family phenazine biosynthesis protein